MRRWGVTVTTALLAGAGALGLAGCGAVAQVAGGPAEQAAVQVAAAMGADGQALAAMGFDTADIAAAAPVPVETVASPGATPVASPGATPGGAPTTGPGRQAAHRRTQARVLMRKNMLHGVTAVQTKTGTTTVDVQRGTVTAIDGQSMTVKSTDGFTMTWTFGPNLRVVERRTTIQPNQVKVGTVLGVAGAKSGANTVARLIVIPTAK
jgi:hypothetical protein